MPANQPDYSAWLTKPQAAEAIGVATKTIEQFAEQKKLQTAMYKRPQGGPAIRVYHPEDVETLRKERNPQAPLFVTKGKPSTALVHSRSRIVMQGTMPEGTLQLMSAIERSKVRIPEKLFLTIPEASQYAGLPQAEIRRRLQLGSRPIGALHEAALPGIRTGAGWRVRRKDLEKL